MTILFLSNYKLFIKPKKCIHMITRNWNQQGKNWGERKLNIAHLHNTYYNAKKTSVDLTVVSLHPSFSGENWGIGGVEQNIRSTNCTSHALDYIVFKLSFKWRPRNHNMHGFKMKVLIIIP